MAPKFTLAVLALVAFAQAVPVVNRIPETELVQGKSDLRTQAVNAIALLQSQGQGDTACRTSAEEVISSINEKTNSSQTLLNRLTSGHECESLGQAAVESARTDLSEAYTRHDYAQGNVSESLTTLVTLNTQKYSDLVKQDCGWIQEDSNYVSQETVWRNTVTEESEASAWVNISEHTLNSRITEAAKMKHECECKVHGEHERMWTSVTADDATDLDAWKQAHEMICVLDRKSIEEKHADSHKEYGCAYDAPPANTKPYIAPAAAEAVCQIATGIVANCNLDQLAGKVFYASETSIHDSSHTHCYHVEVGTIIEQEASQSTIGHRCSAETFEKQYRVGHLNTEMSETKQHYTGGTASEGCKVNGNTAGTRAGTLVVKQDPDVKEHFAEVTESSTCVYDVTITVPAC